MNSDAPSTAKPLTAVEGVKELSRHLRGSLAAELHDGTDHFSTDSTHLVKFHGFYQQDDRDVRRERTRPRGGRCSTGAWCAPPYGAVC